MYSTLVFLRTYDRVRRFFFLLTDVGLHSFTLVLAWARPSSQTDIDPPPQNSCICLGHTPKMHHTTSLFISVKSSATSLSELASNTSTMMFRSALSQPPRSAMSISAPTRCWPSTIPNLVDDSGASSSSCSGCTHAQPQGVRRRVFGGWQNAQHMRCYTFLCTCTYQGAIDADGDARLLRRMYIKFVRRCGQGQCSTTVLTARRNETTYRLPVVSAEKVEQNYEANLAAALPSRETHQRALGCRIRPLGTSTLRPSSLYANACIERVPLQSQKTRTTKYKTCPATSAVAVIVTMVWRENKRNAWHLEMTRSIRHVYQERVHQDLATTASSDSAGIKRFPTAQVRRLGTGM